MKRLAWLLFFSLIVFWTNAQKKEFNYFGYFTQGEIDAANTAKNVDYITKEEKDIFFYCNLSRMYPRKFYKFYQAFLKKDDRQRLLKSEYYHRTLGEELQVKEPVGPLHPDRKMYELAECWALEAGEAGIVGHNRVNCVGGFSGECCSYGQSTGLGIVFQLLIDRGVESLGHRKLIFSGGYRGMGVAIRDHAGYRKNAVLDFTYTNDILRAEQEVKRLAEEARRMELDKRMEERRAEFSELMSQWTKKERAEADVCRSLSYLNDFEKDLYFYVNLIRLYPRKFKKLIWDNGPYFDRFLADLQNDLHRESSYRKVAQTLASVQGGISFVPTEKEVQAGRCIITESEKGISNPASCYFDAGFRSWWKQSFFPEDNYNDIMKILMTPKLFEGIFFKNALVVVESDEYQGSILIMTR